MNSEPARIFAVFPLFGKPSSGASSGGASDQEIFLLQATWFGS
jgi:hypothetical protein